MSPPPNMNSSIAENAGWEEETVGSWADVESPQLCGNSREWLWYLFLLPKEVGIYESHHKHIPQSAGKLQALCTHSIRWNSWCWFTVEFGRKSQPPCLFNSGAKLKKQIWEIMFTAALFWEGCCMELQVLMDLQITRANLLFCRVAAKRCKYNAGKT